MARIVPIFVARDDKEYLWGWSHQLQDATGVKVCPDHFISAFVTDLKRQRQQGKLLDALSELEHAVVRLAVRAEASYGITKRIYKETPDGWVRVDGERNDPPETVDHGPSRYEIARRVREGPAGRKRAHGVQQEAGRDTSRRAHGGIAETGKMRVVVRGEKKRRLA